MGGGGDGACRGLGGGSDDVIQIHLLIFGDGLLLLVGDLNGGLGLVDAVAGRQLADLLSLGLGQAVAQIAHLGQDRHHLIVHTVGAGVGLAVLPGQLAVQAEEDGVILQQGIVGAAADLRRVSFSPRSRLVS